MTIEAVSHIAVGVRDMEVALGFYRDVLGMRVTADKIEEFSQGPGQPPAQRRAGIGREQVERRGFHPVRDRPFDGAVEDVWLVSVEAENETAIHHHPCLVAAPDRFVVVAGEVLTLRVLPEIVGVERLEADEDTSHPSLGRLLD